MIAPGFGGRYVSETLMVPLSELQTAYKELRKDLPVEHYCQEFSGRPTPLTFAQELTRQCGGAQIYLKREDLNHTGAHKINNAIGQILLAKAMGKNRIIAETGAGQHGVATAAVAAKFGLDCTVYMGEKDMHRQAPNVKRMKLMGTEVRGVPGGTLKDAVSEALRDWTTHPDSYYLIGSALGPSPYPEMVRDFQSVIGREAKDQLQTRTGKLPTEVIACVGGGSNAIGMFDAFINTPAALIGVEAGGKGVETGRHAARFYDATPGFFQGMYSYVLQDENGQIRDTDSISAGLDYPSVGPDHVKLFESKRAEYTYATDEQALDALHTLCKTEGILPALESSHAIHTTIERARDLSSDDIILCCLSGRGDKDLDGVPDV